MEESSVEKEEQLTEVRVEERRESTKAALTETNQAKGVECSWESFERKIGRMERVVEVGLEKVRGIMTRRSENKLRRLME